MGKERDGREKGREREGLREGERERRRGGKIYIEEREKMRERDR